MGPEAGRTLARETPEMSSAMPPETHLETHLETHPGEATLEKGGTTEVATETTEEKTLGDEAQAPTMSASAAREQVTGKHDWIGRGALRAEGGSFFTHVTFGIPSKTNTGCYAPTRAPHPVFFPPPTGAPPAVNWLNTESRHWVRCR